LDTEEIVKELKAERNRLDKAIVALDGEDGTRGTMTTDEPSSNAASPATKHHGMSAAGRKRLSLLMKKRWAERRKKSLSGKK
jgi:hypothetical protein